MTSIIISILGFLLAIAILGTVHELGHFLVARAFGIRVERFSIGFGNPLVRWHDKSGTEYVISSIPLGGYVALFGEKNKPITGSERFEAFTYKPVWVRMLVILAGPVCNLILAVVAYWLMFLIGISSLAPIIGSVEKGTIADLAGLHPKQEIVSIEGRPTPSWEAVSVALITSVGEHHTVDVELREDNGTLTTALLDLTSIEKKGSDGDLLKDIGLNPWDPTPALIVKVMPGFPAELAGLKPGDQIVGVDGKSIQSRSELSHEIQSKIDKAVSLRVLREGKQETLQITPVAHRSEEGKMQGFIGVEFKVGEKLPKQYLRLERFGVYEAFQHAVKRTWEYTGLTFSILKKMILGIVSVKQLSGPITIAHYAGLTVSVGIEYFLSFLAVISISLGVINLLPVPLLDGGQLMYCVWELATGRKVSEVAQLIGTWIGGAFIITITLIALYNDIMRF